MNVSDFLRYLSSHAATVDLARELARTYQPTSAGVRRRSF